MQECVEAENRSTLIAIAEDVASSDVDEKIGCFGREGWVKLMAKAFLERLF